MLGRTARSVNDGYVVDVRLSLLSGMVAEIRTVTKTFTISAFFSQTLNPYATKTSHIFVSLLIILFLSRSADRSLHVATLHFKSWKNDFFADFYLPYVSAVVVYTSY